MPTTGGDPAGDLEGDGEENDDRPPFVRKASTYMDSLALLIPEREIPEHESKDVFKVRIARLSNPEEVYDVYMMHKIGRAHV
jgi:hypothetical protein